MSDKYPTEKELAAFKRFITDGIGFHAIKDNNQFVATEHNILQIRYRDEDGIGCYVALEVNDDWSVPLGMMQGALRQLGNQIFKEQIEKRHREQREKMHNAQEDTDNKA